LEQARGQVGQQLSTQQSKLAESIHAVAKELGNLGANSEGPAFIGDLAQQAANKVGAVGHWVQNSDPADVLDQVRTFARRKPGQFLLGAALAGAVAGRLTRNLGAAAKADSARGSIGGGTSATSNTGLGGTGYATTGYSETATGYGDTSYTSSDYTTAPAPAYEAGTTYETGTSQGVGTSPFDPTPGTGRGDVRP
jgi:hypothetical protein